MTGRPSDQSIGPGPISGLSFYQPLSPRALRASSSFVDQRAARRLERSRRRLAFRLSSTKVTKERARNGFHGNGLQLNCVNVTLIAGIAKEITNDGTNELPRASTFNLARLNVFVLCPGIIRCSLRTGRGMAAHTTYDSLLHAVVNLDDKNDLAASIINATIRQINR